LALGSIETRETRADSLSIITQTTARAVSASLVTIAVQRISAGGALLHIAGRTSVASIAEATNVLHGIPGSSVSAASFGSQVLLRPAGTTVIAVIRAQGTLASNTIVAREATAGACGAITGTLVRALGPRVQVIGINHFTNPSEVFRAGTQGAIRTSPLRLAIKTSKAFTVVVHLACSVI